MNFDGIRAEYFRMRASGMEARTVLAQLRSHIVRLEIRQREKLLEELRAWEMGDSAPETGAQARPASETPVSKIKPLAPPPMPRLKLEDTSPQTLPVSVSDSAFIMGKVSCPHCGKPNPRDDVFCYACGQLMTMERGLFDTRHFLDDGEQPPSDEYYGPDSTLALIVSESQVVYRIRPQDLTHEVIIGRSGGATMIPDVDLTEQEAVSFGVSRMHLSISYNEKQRTLNASDLGSANGSFLNGQRLFPGEIRVLRHGDELRLGRLPLAIYFYSGKKS